MAKQKNLLLVEISTSLQVKKTGRIEIPFHNIWTDPWSDPLICFSWALGINDYINNQ